MQRAGTYLKRAVLEHRREMVRAAAPLDAYRKIHIHKICLYTKKKKSQGLV